MGWPAWSIVTTSLGQGTAQGRAEFGELPLRYLGGQDRLRAVERYGPLVQLDRNARLQQAQRVADGFIAVRIELRAGDVGGRQAGQIGGPRRGGVRRGGRRVQCGAQVVPPRCGDLLARHEGVSVKCRADHVSCRSSSSGWLSSWKRIGGPCWSRARNATAAASPAPAA